MHEGPSPLSRWENSEPRFFKLSMVLSSESYILDCQIGTQGRTDFWTYAEAFVATLPRGDGEKLNPVCVSSPSPYVYIHDASNRSRGVG